MAGKYLKKKALESKIHHINTVPSLEEIDVATTGNKVPVSQKQTKSKSISPISYPEQKTAGLDKKPILKKTKSYYLKKSPIIIPNIKTIQCKLFPMKKKRDVYKP